jgi:hypothetical protein
MSTSPIIAGDFVSANLAGTETVPSITAVGPGHITLPTIGFGGATFTVSGTPGTIAFYATGDGGHNWQPLNVMPSNSSTPVNSITAAGLWRINCSSFTHVSMVQTTAGTAGAAIHASPISAGGTGGGGGGPGISNVALVWTNIGSLSVATRVTTALANVRVTTGIATGSITPTQNTLLVSFSMNLGQPTANAFTWAYVYRTTGAVPPAQTNVGTPPAGDVVVPLGGLPIGSTSSVANLSGTVIDNVVTVGQAIHYYLVLGIGGGQGYIDVGSLVNVYQLTTATS